ncbi:MAG: SHOCT domain-containing protein [Luteolibacter sp.]
MIFPALSNPAIALIGGLGSREMLIIVSFIFALFIIVPLFFVVLAIRKSKNSSEKDYTPYHLMEPEERLLMLQQLRAKELISDEEFDKKRKNILRELNESDTKGEGTSEDSNTLPTEENPTS